MDLTNSQAQFKCDLEMFYDFQAFQLVGKVKYIIGSKSNR